MALFRAAKKILKIHIDGPFQGCKKTIKNTLMALFSQGPKKP
jgi:hypothetical protein